MSSCHPLFRKFVIIFLMLHVFIILIYVVLLPEKWEEFVDSISLVKGVIRSWGILKDASVKEASMATSLGGIIGNSSVQCDTLEVLEFLECAKAVVMTRAEGELLVETVKMFSILMEYHNITYIVFGGSLLGIIRHGSYVPYDDDFDVIVLRREKEKIHEIMQKELWPSANDSFFQSSEERRALVKTLNFQLFPYMKYFENHAHPKVYLNFKDCIHPRKFAYCWPFVDLFYFEDNGTHLYSREYRNDIYPYEYVYPLQRGVYSNVLTWIPRNISAFLSPNSLTACCTNGWLHKTERPVTCYKCITCSCLRDWIHLRDI